MGTCYTCPPGQPPGERPFGQPMCAECARLLAHHNIDIDYEMREMKHTGLDACTVCHGTGIEAARREYHPQVPELPGEAHMITTHRCVKCDGSGVEPART